VKVTVKSAENCKINDEIVNGEIEVILDPKQEHCLRVDTENKFKGMKFDYSIKVFKL